MGGKIALATAVVVPFKAKIGEIVPPVKGELRVKDENAAAKRSAVPTPQPTTNTRGTPGGFGDGSGGPAFPLEKGLSIEDIMAVVDSGADTAGGGDDGTPDLERGLGGTLVESKTGDPVDEQESEKDDAAWASGGARLSKTGGTRGSSSDDDDDDGGSIAGGSSSRRLSVALPTVEEGGGEQQADGPGSSCGGDGRTTFSSRKDGKYEDDEKSEDYAPSYGAE